jgi:hypothetical protein
MRSPLGGGDRGPAEPELRFPARSRLDVRGPVSVVASPDGSGTERPQGLASSPHADADRCSSALPAVRLVASVRGSQVDCCNALSGPTLGRPRLSQTVDHAVCTTNVNRRGYDNGRSSAPDEGKRDGDRVHHRGTSAAADTVNFHARGSVRGDLHTAVLGACCTLI